MTSIHVRPKFGMGCKSVSVEAVAKQFEGRNVLPPQDSANNLRVLEEMVKAYAS